MRSLKLYLKYLTSPVHIQALVCHLSGIHNSFKDIKKKKNILPNKELLNQRVPSIA